jgi:hypothetical protein
MACDTSNFLSKEHPSMPADLSRDIYTEDRRDIRGGLESIASGVSWGAIIAGSVAAAAVSIILLFLGAGLGLTAVSPWGNHDGTAKVLGIGVIIWSFLLQVISFGVGGYMAGRLRTKWAAIHRDESYFRDTAHGFLVWALGSMVSFFLLTSTIGHLAQGVGSVAGHGVSAIGEGAMGAGALGGGALAMNGGPMNGGPGGAGMQGSQSPQMTLDYFIDTMMRPNAATGASQTNSQGSTGQATGSGTATQSTTAPADTQAASGATNQPATMDMNGTVANQQAKPLDPQSRAEVSRILVTSIANGSISQPDKDYLTQVVANRTGMSRQDAAKRIDDTYGQIQAAIQKAEDKAKEYADDARKAAIGLTLWSFAAMLAGAFAAAIAGTFGGRARDIY